MLLITERESEEARRLGSLAAPVIPSRPSSPIEDGAIVEGSKIKIWSDGAASRQDDDKLRRAGSGIWLGVGHNWNCGFKVFGTF